MELGKILSSQALHHPLVDETEMMLAVSLTSQPEPGVEYFSLEFWDVEQKIAIDIDGETKRLSFLSTEEVNEKYNLVRKDFIKSGFFHGAVVGTTFLSLAIFHVTPPANEQVVEVAFGLSAEPTRSRQDTEGDADVQATRSQQDLPQLTKNATPDVAPPAKQEPAPDAPVVKEPQKEEELKTEASTKKPEGPKPREDQQKVKMDDYLKRKEQDLRAVDEKKQTGKNRAETAKGKQKSSKDVLPKSPFGSDVPDAPPGVTPAGLETGKSTSAYDSYKTYLARQLKLNWQTPEGGQFSADLVTIVRFTVNSFGHLAGTVEVTRSSGNKEFDALVLEALQSTFPVTTKPPANLKPPVSFSARYTSQGVQ